MVVAEARRLHRLLPVVEAVERLASTRPTYMCVMLVCNAVSLHSALGWWPLAADVVCQLIVLCPSLVPVPVASPVRTRQINHHQVQQGPPNMEWLIRNGEWRDVTPANGVVVRYPTVEFTGEVIVHCHLLEHEDNGECVVRRAAGCPAERTAAALWQCLPAVGLTHSSAFPVTSLRPVRLSLVRLVL